MHRRYHAQRQHIIHSLDALLYQLHTLSFFLSPAIWTFVLRILSQYQCTNPRDFDSTRSLRFFFLLLIFLNAATFWTHATQGAAEGKAVVLDFIGMASAPSKAQLLMLDFFIIFLQMLLTTIAYETSILQDSPDADIGGNVPLISSFPSTPLPTTTPTRPKLYTTDPSSPYIVDLQLSPIIAQLRHPPPPVARNATQDSVLPMPNTTPLPLGMSLLLGVPLRRGPGIVGTTTNSPNQQPGTDAGSRRVIPGSLDFEEGS